MNEKHIVYADSAATTSLSQKALDAMLPIYKNCFGNPSAVYSAGREAKSALEEARAAAAKCIGANANEIYFTGSGTESDNWAIKGAAASMKKNGKNHIITTAFEHHAVLHTCRALEKDGFRVTYLPVYGNGIVKPRDFANSITDKTGLVSVMYANNEIGTIQPIAELAEICRENNILFHTDAVQAVGQVPIDVKTEKIDMLSLSGHKLHGPKGIGILYIRSGVFLQNLLHGGEQERGRRSGTENVAGAVGLAAALEAACDTDAMKERAARLSYMRDRLISEILKINRSLLNGDTSRRLPGNTSFCFEGIEGESLLLMLDMQGICASSGSACTSGSIDPSHVLLAIGLPHSVARGSVRFTFSEDNTDEDIDYIIEKLPPIIERLRKMSPLWGAIQKGKEI
jgi:cysteine desulfurase NifS